MILFPKWNPQKVGFTFVPKKCTGDSALHCIFLAHGEYGALDELVPLVTIGLLLLLIGLPLWRWINQSDDESSAEDNRERKPPTIE
jgi:hypothetical protein